MAAYIRVGQISTGGMANATGQFFGQNIQNGWDSHATTLMSSTMLLGDFSTAYTQWAMMYSSAQMSLPIYDQDVKDVYSPIAQR